MNDIEIFKPIPNYPNYSVSSYGRVLRNGSRGYMRELKPINHNGRLIVSLSYNGCNKKFYIHRLVAEAFIEKEDNQYTVTHIDGDLSNNHYQNLKWK